MAITLLNKVSANGSGAWFRWLGGPTQIFVSGDLDGGTVSIELSDDGGTTISPAKFTDGTDFTVAAAAVPDSFPATGWAQGISVRASLLGGASPTNVNVALKQG